MAYFKRDKSKYFWTGYYFLFGSFIPLMLFLIEFRTSNNLDIAFKTDFDKFTPYVIKAYSPLFLYALLAGFILPLYIVPAYQYLNTIIIDKKINNALKKVLLFAFIVSIIVAIVDFFGGDPAIWEVKPPHFERFVHHFVNADTSTNLRGKEQYKQGIEAILNSGINNWSITRFSYFFSIVIESLFLNIYFYVCFFYFSFRYILKKSNENTFQEITNGLILSNLLIFVWLLLRLVSNNEKQQLYPNIPLQIADIAVSILNLICLLTIIITKLSNNKVQKIFQQIFNIATLVGISGSSVFAIINKDIITHIFGRKDGYIVNYVAIPIVFLLLYFAYYLINLGNEYNARYDIQDEEDS